MNYSWAALPGEAVFRDRGEIATWCTFSYMASGQPAVGVDITPPLWWGNGTQHW